MYLTIKQLARQHEWLDYRVELIAEDEEERKLLLGDYDRCIEGFSISPDLEGTEGHKQAFSQALNELWEVWVESMVGK